MSETDTLAPARTPDGLLSEINAFFRNGEFFRSYDLAEDALAAYPDDLKIALRGVLSLANAGATDLALAKFDAHRLAQSQHMEARTLFGRLKKDQAYGATGARHRALLAEARSIYETAYRAAQAARNPEAYYPGINAATLALLAGDPALAGTLALEVLSQLGERMAAWTGVDTPDRYWVLATAIEAHLITGDLAAARALVGPAILASGLNYADLSSTGRQLERILEAKGLHLDTLDGFVPPTIIHYVGHIISAPGRPGRFPALEQDRVAAQIGQVLDGMRIGGAYGSLAAGSDLLFVEALQARGIAVNIVLPFNKHDMIEQSVRTAGEDWVARFETCLEGAKTVRYATEDRYLGDDHLFTYCSRLAMGLAVLFARHMYAPLKQLVVWDGEARSGVAGTVADMKTWIKAGHPQTIIRCGLRETSEDLADYRRPDVPRGRRDTRAMLFGDIHGFSKLTDEQLPIFAEAIMGALGKVIQRHKDDIAFVNTWGDGIFVVFPDAGRAAECALAMQDALHGLDLAALGLPGDLTLRLGGHLGPVYELPDLVMNRPNYYGAHVSRAARIEPITPEGCVYVTETFAAVLALHNAREFSCDYVGYTDMAKHYGRLRMFLLRRHRHGKGPAVIADIERPPLDPETREPAS